MFVSFKKISLFVIGLLLFCGMGQVAHGATKPHYTIGTETTNVPFGIQGKDGSYNGRHPGLDIELLRAIAKKGHFTYQLKIMSFTGIVQAVQGNQIDGVMAGLMKTPERQAVLDFSKPYINASLSLVAKPGSNIHSLKDLRGKTIAVKTGSTSEAYAKTIQKKYGFKVRHFDATNTALNDVVAGNTAAAIDMTVTIQYAIKNGLKLHLVSTPDDSHQIGFAVKKGQNQALLTSFNQGLAAIKRNGTYDRIVHYYTGAHSHVVRKTQTDRSFIGLIKQNAPELLAGVGLTLKLAVVSIILATLVGIVFGIGGILPNRLLHSVFVGYTFVFRSIPLMVLAFFIYIGLPSLTGQKIPLFPAGVTALVLENSAYIAVFICGGIQAIDRGQMEASRSLGVPYIASLRKVILPQAIRNMIPALINQAIMLLKGTSILSAIGLAELTQQGTMIIARNMEGFKIWLLVALIYLILIGILTGLSAWVSRRFQMRKDTI